MINYFNALFQYKNQYIFLTSIIFFLLFLILSIYQYSLLIFFISCIILFIIILSSEIIINKILSIYLLTTYLIPVFVMQNYYTYTNFKQISFSIYCILIYIFCIFLMEFIVQIFFKKKQSNSINNEYTLNKTYLLIFLIFSTSVLFLNLFDLLLNNVQITNDFNINKKYTNLIFSLPVIGQILKKIYFFGFLLLIFLSFGNKEKLIYFSLILVYFINAILNASRYEVGLLSISLLILFRNDYKFYILIILSPLFAKFASFFREIYNFHRINEIANFNLNTSYLFINQYLDNFSFISKSGRNIFIETFINYYERLIFLDEYLKIFYLNLRSDDIKYFLNFFLLIPSFIRNFFTKINILPYSNEETRAIGLNSYDDNISTVSLGHIAESIYILDEFFFITPIILGIIIYYYNNLIKNFNSNFYIAFSISFALLLVMKESLSAISLDLIMITLMTFILKKYFIHYKS